MQVYVIKHINHTQTQSKQFLSFLHYLICFFPAQSMRLSYGVNEKFIYFWRNDAL